MHTLKKMNKLGKPQ